MNTFSIKPFFRTKLLATLASTTLLISLFTLPLLAAPEPQTQVIATNLQVPWQIDFAPNQRIFITERGGSVLVLNRNAQGNWTQQTWLQLTNVYLQGEAGLLGLAIDPLFDKTGYVYLAYNYQKNGKPYNRLVRYREAGTASKRFGVLDKVILENIPAAIYHNGGRLKFHPDQTLFWSLGDRLVPNSAQELAALTGKILRLNRDGSIPKDNPFANSYVYSYGHRNVQGITFTSSRPPRIFASEHGPSSWPSCCRDEVNEIRPGSNYGWPLITGAEQKKPFISPLLHSGNRTTWAPGGLAYVDTGAWKHSLLLTGLRGQALYHIALTSPQTAKAFVGVRKVNKTDEVTILFKEKWGRLRDIARAPIHYGFAGHYYLLTSNRDGRGRPKSDDDKIIRIILP